MSVQRITRIVQASATIANGAAGTLDFLHPTSGITPERGDVKTLGIPHTPPEGGANSLPPSQANDTPTEEINNDAGFANILFYGDYSGAAVWLTGIWLIDRTATILATVFDDATTGIATNSAVAANLLGNIKIGSGEGVRIRVANASGGNIGATAPAGGGKCTFRLGINANSVDVTANL